MELLRKLSNFTKPKKDKLQIYKVYIGSVLEQSSVVWGSSLSKKNERDLERVQKAAVMLIMGKYDSYEESLKSLKLQSLKDRRNLLSVNFAMKCLKNENIRSIFIKNTKVHRMNLRNTPKFKVKHAKTVRMKKSAIINMTHQLNKHHEQKEEILRCSKY